MKSLLLEDFKNISFNPNNAWQISVVYEMQVAVIDLIEFWDF